MNVESVLTESRNESLLFVPNPGNAGDGLIAAAEYFMLRRLGLKFRVADANLPVDVRESETVVYGGGGNLVGLYGNASRYLTACHAHVRRVIVLPHTIRENESLLLSFGENVTIFCRELESFRHVRSVNSKLSCYLDHDMAFGLPVAQILTRSKSLGYKFSDLLNIRSLKRLVRLAQYVARSKGNFLSLNAFRGDVEGCGRDAVACNADLSQLLSGDNMSEEACRETAYAFLKFLSLFEHVRTDRLHVCIAAALLGRRVEFFDNSYGKNASVYRYSISNRFSKVCFMEK